MTVVREIASTPTVTNPGSDQGIQNPGPDLLGRPIQEARIDSIRMLGVADPDGTIRFGVLVEETEPLFTGKMLTMSGIIVLTVILLLFARVDKPASLHQDTIVTYDAMLISDEDKPD